MVDERYSVVDHPWHTHAIHPRSRPELVLPLAARLVDRSIPVQQSRGTASGQLGQLVACCHARIPIELERDLVIE